MARNEEAMDLLPVRRRLKFLRDGSTRAAELVFCETRRESVPISQCAACPFSGSVAWDLSGPSAMVECCHFSLPMARSGSEPLPSGERLLGPGAAEVAATLPVGLSIVRPFVCVAHDAPLSVAMRALAMESSPYGVAVVDDDDRFVGMLVRARAALALLHAEGEVAADHVTAGWCSVHEAESLGDAFVAMTARHAREVAVVSEEGALVGVLRDIDALRFVAFVSRTGQRPPLDSAA
jgi:CBS domain-containing protein